MSWIGMAEQAAIHAKEIAERDKKIVDLLALLALLAITEDEVYDLRQEVARLEEEVEDVRDH